MIIPYKEQLNDPRWQRKRLEIYERDNWACRICNSTERPLTVHHRLYESKYAYAWDYPNYYLLTVCLPCHEWLKELIESGQAICINCYHFKDGYCLCREFTEMVETGCLD